MSTTMTATDEHGGANASGVVDVELAPMGGAGASRDDESIGSAESEFSNDEGMPNDYKPGGAAGIRVMDEAYVNNLEQQRRRSTFCMALILLALGVAILKFVGGGGGPSPPTLSLTDDDGDWSASSDAAGRRIKFTVTNLKGKEGKEGSFTIETRPEWAPIGVERFEALVEAKFYDGCRIFRVLPGFVSQWGIGEDPLTQADWDAQPLQDDSVLTSNKRGTISFATAGPNTRTTQVFINTKDNKRLDKMGFAPFAEVIEGMDVVDLFYSGYGEGAPDGKGPDQSKMEKKGATYIDKGFPKLSYFKKAEFVG